MSRAAWFPSLHYRIAVLSILGLCVFSNVPSFAEDAWDGSGLLPSLITFRDVPGPSELDFISSLGGHIKYAYDFVPTVAAWLPDQAAAALTGNPGEVRIEPDVRLSPLDAELANSWGVQHIGAGVAHASGNKGAGVKVAFIDSGIDYTHPELAASYAGGWDFVNHDADPRDDYGHGTRVAGIVGAADNGTGIVGVAPEAHHRATGQLTRRTIGWDVW